jgi:hypothetical protein
MIMLVSLKTLRKTKDLPSVVVIATSYFVVMMIFLSDPEAKELLFAL